MITLSPSDISMLKSSVFYGALPKGTFQVIVERSRVLELDSECVLFHKGEPSKAVFAVLSGMVKLTLTREDGREVLVECFESGTSFAEAMAFGADAYPVTATSIVASRVLSTPLAAIDEALSNNSDGYKALLGATYRHLHSLVKQIEELKGNTGLDRVARYIWAMSDAEQGGRELEIPFDKKVLAAKLGIKPESLSRAFRRLEAHGVIVERMRITVSDRAALSSFLNRKT